LNPVALYVSYPRSTVGKELCVEFCVGYCAETALKRAVTTRVVNISSQYIQDSINVRGAILLKS
jgi:hypothetical protein